MLTFKGTYHMRRLLEYSSNRVQSRRVACVLLYVKLLSETLKPNCDIWEITDKLIVSRNHVMHISKWLPHLTDPIWVSLGPSEEKKGDCVHVIITLYTAAISTFPNPPSVYPVCGDTMGSFWSWKYTEIYIALAYRLQCMLDSCRSLVLNLIICRGAFVHLCSHLVESWCAWHITLNFCTSAHHRKRHWFLWIRATECMRSTQSLFMSQTAMTPTSSLQLQLEDALVCVCVCVWNYQSGLKKALQWSKIKFKNDGHSQISMYMHCYLWTGNGFTYRICNV